MAATDTSICTMTEAIYLERVRFFPRQLITPDDLTQDQEYFRSKMRRHNRLLHGWGVVCGAGVTTGEGPSELAVQTGYILGPWGDEIVIEAPVTIDVCKEGLDGNAATCAGGSDPWCGDVRINRTSGQPLYVAVKYAQCQSRPILAFPGACGCNEAECEYSRVRDGFAIKMLSKLPSMYDPMPETDLEAATSCTEDMQDCGRPCPPCPAEPWVILADVTVNADCSIATVDCLAHRRFVATFGNYYFQCAEAVEPTPAPEPVPIA
jgi:hypothetical protein